MSLLMAVRLETAAEEKILGSQERGNSHGDFFGQAEF
jgi:hypothetical protein